MIFELDAWRCFVSASDVGPAVQDFRGAIVDSEPLVCTNCTDELHRMDTLLQLVATVSRNAPKFIEGLSPETEPQSAITLLGEVERQVARQVTLSQDWRLVWSARQAVSESKTYGRSLCPH